MEEEGDIAPGMEVIFEILFKANSLADYRDELIIITEKNNFTVDWHDQIPLVAFREQPVLNLKPHLEINSCWVGQNSRSTLTISNKGGHAGFWVVRKEDRENAIVLKPPSFDNPEPIQVGFFTIYPDRFFLSKGQSVNFEIDFNPSDEGKFSETFLLGCDNLNVYEYTLFAEANMIELVPTAINSVTLTQDCMPLNEIHFRKVEFLNPQSKTVEIENFTKNKVMFEWRKADSNQQFTIEPSQGVFDEREKKTFTITYHASSLEPNFSFMELFIFGIPPDSVRNPPSRIYELIQKRKERKQEGLEDEETFEFCYYSLKTLGEVSPVFYAISPELLSAPLSLPINRVTDGRYTIKNHSNSASEFSISVFKISNPDLRLKIVGVFRSEHIPDEPASPTSPAVATYDLRK